MRISDWSSDVCSSDLQIQRIDGIAKDYVSPPEDVLARIRADAEAAAAARAADRPVTDFDSGFAWPAEGPISGVYGSQRILNGEPRQPHYGVDIAGPVGTPVKAPADGRSEEHTSELQSLMRISYAVFCLKKKKQT